MTDYKKLLQDLLNENVRFLIVGGYAAIAHGLTRATDDIDIWIDATTDNAQKTLRALKRFDIHSDELTVEKIMEPYAFFRVGEDSGRKVDIMSNAGGNLEFHQAWPNRLETEFFGCCAPFVGLKDLMRIKRDVGRHKDLADVESLCAFHRLPNDD